MKDFGAWFAEQGKAQPGAAPEEDETGDMHWFRCRRCGKTELVTRLEYENGDVAWYAEDEDFKNAVCGGGPFCLP